jgi:hypothetical protein
MTLPKFMKKWDLLIRDIRNATGQYIAKLYTVRGKQIRSISEVEHGVIYVAAGHEPFKMLSYADGTNIGTDRSVHDIHKAGFRKNEDDYKERMDRLWWKAKAVQLNVHGLVIYWRVSIGIVGHVGIGGLYVSCTPCRCARSVRPPTPLVVAGALIRTW